MCGGGVRPRYIVLSDRLSLLSASHGIVCSASLPSSHVLVPLPPALIHLCFHLSSLPRRRSHPPSQSRRFGGHAGSSSQARSQPNIKPTEGRFDWPGRAPGLGNRVSLPGSQIRAPSGLSLPAQLYQSLSLLLLTGRPRFALICPATLSPTAAQLHTTRLAHFHWQYRTAKRTRHCPSTLVARKPEIRQISRAAATAAAASPPSPPPPPALHIVLPGAKTRPLASKCFEGEFQNRK